MVGNSRKIVQYVLELVMNELRAADIFFQILDIQLDSSYYGAIQILKL